jgi:hypothetical protein
MRDRGKVKLLAQQDQREEARRQLRELRPACSKLTGVVELCVYMLAYRCTLVAIGNTDIPGNALSDCDDTLEALEELVRSVWGHASRDALDGKPPEPPPDLAA